MKAIIIGLMYSQKESIIKDHYTVTLSMSPIPNGGYMFEVHKDKIYVIENATFDDNLQYLLSMGVKSFADIIKTEPKNLDELACISEWLERTHKNNLSKSTSKKCYNLYMQLKKESIMEKEFKEIIRRV